MQNLTLKLRLFYMVFLNHIYCISERTVLHCGLLAFLVASFGVIILEKSYQKLLTLKSNEMSLQYLTKSYQKNIVSNCAASKEKELFAATLHIIETNAARNNLTVHNIVQKKPRTQSMEWVVSGEYHNIITWLNFISDHPVEVLEFHLWRANSPSPDLFFSSEIVIYETPIC